MYTTDRRSIMKTARSESSGSNHEKTKEKIESTRQKTKEPIERLRQKVNGKPDGPQRLVDRRPRSGIRMFKYTILLVMCGVRPSLAMRTRQNAIDHTHSALERVMNAASYVFNAVAEKGADAMKTLGILSSDGGESDDVEAPNPSPSVEPARPRRPIKLLPPNRNISSSDGVIFPIPERQTNAPTPGVSERRTRTFWQKIVSAFIWDEDTPKWWKNSFNIVSLGLILIGIFVPYVRHHDLGWMNAQWVETISGTLATHAGWSKGFTTAGTLLGFVGLCNWVREDRRKHLTEEQGWFSQDKILTGAHIFSSMGYSAQIGVVWFPIGAASANLHDWFALAFFGPTAIGMLLYTCAAWKVSGGCKCSRLAAWYTLLSVLVCSFALYAQPGKSGFARLKLPLKDCLERADRKGDTELAAICKRDEMAQQTEWGSCRKRTAHYGTPALKFCKIDLNEVNNADDLNTACAAAEGQCEVTNEKMTNWNFTVAKCQSKNKHLRDHADDKCGLVKAPEDGSEFEAQCLDSQVTDANGDQCEYYSAAQGRAWFTAWSVYEVVAFVSIFMFMATAFMCGLGEPFSNI